VKWGSGVAKIASGKKAAALQRFGGAAHKDAIHDDVAPGREIGSDKLVLGRDVREQNIGRCRQSLWFRLAQVGQSDESVVSRIEPQDARCDAPFSDMCRFYTTCLLGFSGRSC